MFLMLALAVLNYGSRLETLITSTKKRHSLLTFNNGGGNAGDDSLTKRQTRRLIDSSQDHLI